MATRKTPQDWQALIELQQQSNLTVKAFCEQQQIASSNFYHWRKLLKQDNQTIDVQSGAWQTIEVVEPRSNESPSTAQTWDVELTFPNGLTLRMRQ